MGEAFARVPALAAQHLLLALAALALGVLVALPLGLWSARSPRAARLVLGAAGVVQTIPGLALLALFYPVLLLVGTATGLRVPALGFLPALLALALYALLPVIRNMVTALQGIDPAVIAAADGIGMTPGQKLRWVELPLILPVLMAGVRTAAVWTIGAATLSTTVGQPSLGDLIFAGLQTQAWALVVAGCVAAAGLALGVDGLLALAQRGVARRRPAQAWAALAVLALAALAAAAPLLQAARQGPPVVVGAKNFSEQYILARLIGERLRRAGYRVDYRDGLGSAVAFRAVAAGTVDVYVDYAGTIWTGAMGRRDSPPRARQLAAISAWAARAHGVGMVGALGFENAYALAMRGDAARRLGVATIDDLVPVAPRLALGADLEFLDRPDGRRCAAPIRCASPRRRRTAPPSCIARWRAGART